MAKKKSARVHLVTTLEELEAELEEAKARWSKSFVHGTDEDITAAAAAVRACEQQINDAYYRRWSLP